MPSRNRDTLKYFFSDGALPSSEMFGDLIDSMLNMDDEGFNKTDENGFEITNLGEFDSLISFFKQSHPGSPVWQISFEGSENNLVISRVNANKNNDFSSEDLEKAKYFLNLNVSGQKPKIGIGIVRPHDALHIAGNIRAEGRRGEVSRNYSQPLADGNWYTIGGPYVGCQTLEVVARAKNDARKRYGLMHAIAMHTISPVKKDIFNFFGLKNRIKYTHSFYESFLHRLKLRWQPAKERGQYILQLRTNCDYGDEGVIDYHITNLWSDKDVMRNTNDEDQNYTDDETSQ
ncbi:MAG TPA: hypothetical protein ENJ08_07890 [Gammaproteobacteria bacterium]|nr:hypothetical protein [Gammaproteobacteria bacterium]